MWKKAWMIYFLRLAWVRFKAAFGLPIDVDKNFYAADAAWRLKTGKLPQGIGITCWGRNDGVGMQTLSRISGLNFAAAFGARYVHTPFQYVEHSDRDISEWVAAWESFFGLGKGEATISDRRDDIVDYADYFLGRRKISPSTVLQFQQCYWPARVDPNTYRAIIPALREKYGLRPRPVGFRPLRIAVHVRRGDVSANRNASRYTRNEQILTTLAKLRRVLDQNSLTYEVNVFSEGEPEDFAGFKAFGCTLELNRDALATLRSLIDADVLVMSKSSFCYAAALISVGIKLYQPWVNGPLSSWIIRDTEGDFDADKFLRELRDLETLTVSIGEGAPEPSSETRVDVGKSNDGSPSGATGGPLDSLLEGLR